MPIRNVVFDLDGTLADTSVGINRAFDAASRDMGLPALGPEERSGLIGPPVKGSFIRLYGLSEREAEAAAERFRARYAEPERLAETEIYPGVREMLAGLRELGLGLGVATNKRTDCAEAILDRFGLGGFFRAVRGSESGSYLAKPDILRSALSGMGAAPQEAALVGDTATDAEAAGACGIGFVAVTYGFGYAIGGVPDGVASAGSPQEVVDALRKLCPNLNGGRDLH